MKVRRAGIVEHSRERTHDRRSGQARERRRALWAGVLGLGMGFTLLVLGVNSVRTGQWVEFGRVGSTFELPGFVAVLMALFLLYISGWVILRFASKP